jgi:hypothetical protein
MWNENLRRPDQSPKGRGRDLASTGTVCVVQRRSLDGAARRAAPLGTTEKDEKNCHIESPADTQDPVRFLSIFVWTKIRISFEPCHTARAVSDPVRG